MACIIKNAPVSKAVSFYNDTMDFTEKDTRYVPGGYHPAIIGNILGGSPQRQYRLMHKLGWGSYATVWLAQKIDEPNTFVAVKITTAEDDDARTEEIEMLRKAQPDDQSYSHVVNLLDYFKLNGPNGIYNVIVTDVVVPILSFPRQPPAWRKAAAYGVVQAMIRLHASQIVHGDWHLGNIGIAVPQLADQNPDDVMRNLGEYNVSIVLTENPAKQTASLPAYLTFPCNMGPYCQKIAGSDPPQMKIFDFGAAHEIGKRPRMFQCAAEGCAPEVAFALTVQEKNVIPAIDPPADVWALGSSIYEIVTGSTLLWRATIGSVPYCACKIAGHVPTHWEEWAARSNLNVTQADAEKLWDERWMTIRKGCESDEDTNMFIRLLKSVLVLDPLERPTAAQILNDPWFQSVSNVNATAPAAPPFQT